MTDEQIQGLIASAARIEASTTLTNQQVQTFGKAMGEATARLDKAEGRIASVEARVSTVETQITAGVHAVDPFPAPTVRPPAPSLTTEVRESLRAQSVDIGKMTKNLSAQTVADVLKLAAIAGAIAWAAWSGFKNPATALQSAGVPVPVVIVADAGK